MGKVKVQKSIEKKAITLKLNVPCDMLVESTDSLMDTVQRIFIYYERADLRGAIDCVADAMEEGEPMARDVQDAIDETVGSAGWRVRMEGLNDKYKERAVVVVKKGCVVSLDNVGWIEYTFPIEYVGEEEE